MIPLRLIFNQKEVIMSKPMKVGIIPPGTPQNKLEEVIREKFS